MTDVASDFAAFFHQVWGFTPFEWQAQLAQQVVSTGRWPSVIDLPTGSGKTSALDIAVYAMSILPQAMPRRIAFVVDRRTIVDQTIQRADRLSARLRDGLADPGSAPLGRVARVLAGLSGSDVVLDTGRLRGGAPTGIDLHEWLRWPDQPAVVVSTVDQFGSRLLFRGYGVSRRMAPIHAGLAGNDTLVLLDEVHLSTALAETLDALEGMRPRSPVTRPNQVVRMSATPGVVSHDRFPLDRSLLTDDPRLAPRLGAHKRCRIMPDIGKKNQAPAMAWVSGIGALIDELGIDDGVVAVVVNRVATAVAVHQALAAAGHDTLLITGRMRGLERTAADTRATAWTNADRDSQPGVRFVVATQCIEVGADYSFDALITEACPLASLRQRLGRLDRRGTLALAGTPGQALIVATAGQPSEDPVYGTALNATVEALRQRFGDDEFDGGPMSQDLDALGSDLDVAAPHAAVLMPADLDELASTTTERQLDATVDALLHGFREPNADVSVVWRFDLPQCTNANAPAATVILNALPAQPLERLEIPVAAVRRWLADATSEPAAVADVDPHGHQPSVEGDGRGAWRLDDDHVAQAVSANDLYPGDVIFVPTSYGGLTDGVWNPDSEQPVTDIADQLTIESGWIVLRPRDDDPWRIPERSEDADDAAMYTAFVDEANHRCPGAGSIARPTDVVVYGDRWAVVRPLMRTLDGRDTTNSHLGVSVPLTDHLQGVASTTRAMAKRCGLPPELIDDLGLAGEIHDLGKADERFQLSLVGDVLAMIASNALLAKSGRPGGHIRTGDEFWDYPEGTRHEYLSVALAETCPELMAEAHDPDLVLHLVTTHHGNARPWPVIVTDPSPRDIEVDIRGHLLRTSTRLDDGFGARAAMRFHRLTRRYGHHGLAWLEAVLRLADHRRSESEATR